MPWSWGKKSEPPTAPPPPAETPLAGPPGPFRFRVDDVYTITGIGCVAVGELLEGTIRPPADARVVRGTAVEMSPVVVRIKTIQAHHKEQPELRPGVPAGLQLGNAAIVPGSTFETVMEGGRHRWAVAKGDELRSV